MFIEVTSNNGNKILINLNAVEDIINSTIYFRNRGDYVSCKESYVEILEKIKAVGAMR